MLKEGLEIKEYTLKKFLGRGGFGEVWLAEKRIELADRRVLVALKFISGENQRLSDYSNVRREINTWIDASGDKNVVSVYDGFIFDDLFVIVSEYADGGSLRGWLRQNGGKSPSLEKTVEIMSGILDGLSHLHSQKIVHRDLKPENILLKGNIPCIADFGVSRMLETASITSSNFGTNSAGSPLYMSPESFERTKPTPQVDIWSAGVILFEMLSGKTPYIGDTIPALIFEIVSKEPRNLPSDIPENIQNVVNKALTKRPSERFQTAREMRDALMKAFYLQDYQQTFAREDFITTKKKFVPEDSPAQTLFTDKYLQDTLRENGLVRTFQEQTQKTPIWNWIFAALGMILVVSLLILSAVSLYYNKKLVDEASEKGTAVLNIYRADANSKINPLEKDPTKTRQEIFALEDLRQVLIKLDEYEREGAPWYMRFGLYSGDKIYLEKLLPVVYINAVEQRFKEPVVRKLEDDLRKFASSSLDGNPEQQEAVLEANYDLLTVYLMLSDEHKQRAEATTLINALEKYWIAESKLPPELTEVARQQLEFYARQADREQFPPLRIDMKLVADVRQKLRNYPAVNRYYKRKVAEISKEIEDKTGTVTAERVLASNGGDTGFIEGIYKVPGAFTLEGNKLMKTAISEASQKLSEDDWRMGEQGVENITQSSDFAMLEQRYYRDYADHWKNFVKGLNVKPYDKQNADDALMAFSSANSPVEMLVKEIARQTNLSAEPKPGWIDWLISFFRRTKPTNTGGNTQVEREFRPLFVFIGEDGKPEPFAKYRSAIGSVANKFSQFSSYEIEQVSQDFAKGDITKFPQLPKAEADVRSLLGVFNQTASGQEIAAFLQEPLGNLQTLLSVGEQEQLAETWSEKLLTSAKNLERSYPFEAVETEADLTNLRAYLNPQTGELSKFFNDRLKNYFETVDGQLKPKESSEVKFSDEFVAYLNNAFRLRRALYGETGSTEKFEYDFNLNPAKDAIIEITIDGQEIKTNETASAKLTFPASSGQTGVQMKLMNLSQNSQSDSSSEKKWQGTWGLFKFFDDGVAEKQPNGSYLLKYNFGGKAIRATITPSGKDLFDKNLFRSVRAPEIMMK